MRDDGFKQKGERFKFEIKKKLFTMRMVRCWIRLLREVVDALEMLRRRRGRRRKRRKKKREGKGKGEGK